LKTSSKHLKSQTAPTLRANLARNRKGVKGFSMFSLCLSANLTTRVRLAYEKLCG
jgi:hypothetical protein